MEGFEIAGRRYLPVAAVCLFIIFFAVFPAEATRSVSGVFDSTAGIRSADFRRELDSRRAEIAEGAAVASTFRLFPWLSEPVQKAQYPPYAFALKWVPDNPAQYQIDPAGSHSYHLTINLNLSGAKAGGTRAPGIDFNRLGRGELIKEYVPDAQRLSSTLVGNDRFLHGRPYISALRLYDHRARFYDPETLNFLQPDPLGPVDSPNLYQGFGFDALNVTDPWGLEKIVVSGADPQYYGKFKYKFIEPAIKRLKEYAARADDEQVTWAIFAGGYSQDDLEVFRKFDDEHSNIGVVFIFSKKGLVTYLNSKGTAETKLTEVRSKDRITELSVFSHGLPNTLEFYYGQKGSKEELGTLTVEDVKLLDPNAFDQPIIDLFSCGSAYYSKDPGEELSEEEFRKRLDETLAGVIAERTKGVVSGFVGESSYSFQYLHPGESYLKRRWAQGSNGFNIEGSKGYPGPGNGTGARGTYVPNSGKVVIDRRQR